MEFFCMLLCVHFMVPSGILCLILINIILFHLFLLIIRIDRYMIRL